MGSATVIQPSDKDQLELLKLKAEAEKAQAERDKAVEEARQAKGLFAQLGKVFTPVVAALTIIFGYLAATHSQRVAEADLKVAKADVEQKELQAAAASAQRNLADAKAKLTDTNTKIVAANSAREKAELAEKSTRARLSGIQKEYKSLQATQTQQITLGNLRKLIDILDSEPPERQTAGSRYIEDIRKEVAGDGGYLNPRLTYLVSQAQETNNRPALRGLLYYALFKVTGSNDWLDQIRRLASRELISSWRTFSSLIDLEVFDVKDRADVLCSAYGQYISKPHDEAEARVTRKIIFDIGAATLAKCRKPYLDNLRVSRSSETLNDFIRWAQGQAGFPIPGYMDNRPPEEILIGLLKENPTIKIEVQYSKATMLHFFGVPADFMEAITAGSGRQWLDKHKKLVDAWTKPGLPALDTVSDSTMKKVIEGHWIYEAELP